MSCEMPDLTLGYLRPICSLSVFTIINIDICALNNIGTENEVTTFTVYVHGIGTQSLSFCIT